MTFRTQAIVLRSMPWPKQAKFFVLYTPGYGKLRGVAMGAQKVKSKVAGHLQPFGLSEVMVARGRSVDRIAQARLERRFGALGSHYHLYVLASYALEVVDRLAKEGIGDQLLWNELVALLQELDDQGAWGAESGQTRFPLLVRQFAFRVLDRLGYRPELRHCVSCGKPVAPERIFFSVLQGGLVCGACFPNHVEGQPVTASCVKLLRASLDRPLTQASRLLCDHSDARLAVTIIDQLIAVQLQEPLRSAAMLMPVQETAYFV